MCVCYSFVTFSFYHYITGVNGAGQDAENEMTNRKSLTRWESICITCHIYCCQLFVRTTKRAEMFHCERSFVHVHNKIIRQKKHDDDAALPVPLQKCKLISFLQGICWYDVKTQSLVTKPNLCLLNCLRYKSDVVWFVQVCVERSGSLAFITGWLNGSTDQCR